MERLGGLLNRMPATGLFVLIGSAAISALPPLNGFASDWLLLQSILLSPQLPQWALKILAPAVGATLALAAALAAACFVRVFGIAFLGRPRSPSAKSAREVDPISVSTMGILAALCLLAGIFPAFVIDKLAPAVRGLTGAQMPMQEGIPWLSIAPIAESSQLLQRSSRIPVHRGLRLAHCLCDPSDRLQQASARAGLGLRLSQRRSGYAIYRGKFCPADPARVRRLRIPRS